MRHREQRNGCRFNRTRVNERDPIIRATCNPEEKRRRERYISPCTYGVDGDLATHTIHITPCACCVKYAQGRLLSTLSERMFFLLMAEGRKKGKNDKNIVALGGCTPQKRSAIDDRVETVLA